jgi:hypothetical protein
MRRSLNAMRNKRKNLKVKINLKEDLQGRRGKKFLVKRILEIEEVRHSGIVKMFHSLQF